MFFLWFILLFFPIYEYVFQVVTFFQVFWSNFMFKISWKARFTVWSSRFSFNPQDGGLPIVCFPHIFANTFHTRSRLPHTQHEDQYRSDDEEPS
jgi:hypothetical protein